MGLYYNGYSPNERSRRVRALRKERTAIKSVASMGPCEICGDPEGPFDHHSEDNSWPYRLNEYRLCRICHRQKLHRRFSSPNNWAAFCAHVRRGGYGRDTAKPAIKAELKNYQKFLNEGKKPNPLPLVVGRLRGKGGWWEKITCDREVLAQFDTRNRADADILRALKASLPDLDKFQTSLIKAHYKSVGSTCSISELAKKVKSSSAASVRAAYQNVGKIICENSEYEPPVKENGSAGYLSIIAHHQINSGSRTEKWEMNSSFKKAAKKLKII
jgi:hypothetical protein